MTFNLEKSIAVLKNTPAVLNNLLIGIADEWVYATEGPGTWSAFDVVGHLIVCEQNDFITRTAIILSAAKDKTFTPIDRAAQFEMNKGKKINELLDTFAMLRHKNIGTLISLNLTGKDLQKTGTHPRIGEATLKELLSTWVTHDLNHIAQITRVMAMQYKDEVGGYIEFIGIINKK